MKPILRLALLLFLISYLGISNSLGNDDIFKKYKVVEFDFQGHTAKIVFPKKANEEKYWIWRARFWGHEPQTDLALLEKGFHVVYVDVAGLFGNKEAVNLWNNFYTYLTNKYNLNSKVVLEGMSRGGLIIYNWAAVNTDKVACIYADAPVCDIKSWPGGLYNGKGSQADWEECLKIYNLDVESVLNFKNIPINNAIKVAKAGIPALHICGAADIVVPYEENSKLLINNFKAAGGDISVILKPGVGHHPHSLENPKLIVNFILKNTLEKNKL